MKAATPAPRPTLAKALFLWALSLIGLVSLLAYSQSALAQPREEAPGRVGRVVQVQGKAWLYDDEQNRWVEAQRNRALTEGDRLSTERGARAQLAIGSTELRLSGDTEISFERLDDERMTMRVHNGSLAVRVRNREVARELELRAGDVRAWTERVGHYRIDREDGVTTLTSWRGSLNVDARDQRIIVDGGRSIELFREGRDASVVTWGQVAHDAFSDWVSRDESRDDRQAAERYVSPEMTGADDLDRYGRWDRHPDFGSVWVPLRIDVGWAPFRYGRWTWHVRWGWTWMDDAPWGFATSHYGRWASWGGRWIWVPGAYVARPVYSPALVAWVGGGSGVSVGIGLGPTVGWLPLSPRDVYVPPFRHPPRYFDRVNQPHVRPGFPPQVPTGPISYGNNGVPNAVTVVPSNVLQQRQPVAPAVVRDPEVYRRYGREPFHSEAPAPARVVAVPGGAVPVQPSPGNGRPPAPGSQGRQVAQPSQASPVVLGVPAMPIPTAPVSTQPAPVIMQPTDRSVRHDDAADHEQQRQRLPRADRAAPQAPPPAPGRSQEAVSRASAAVEPGAAPVMRAPTERNPAQGAQGREAPRAAPGQAPVGAVVVPPVTVRSPAPSPVEAGREKPQAKPPEAPRAVPRETSRENVRDRQERQ